MRIRVESGLRKKCRHELSRVENDGFRIGFDNRFVFIILFHLLGVRLVIWSDVRLDISRSVNFHLVFVWGTGGGKG